MEKNTTVSHLEESRDAENAIHPSGTLERKAIHDNPDYAQLVEDARIATEQEHAMTFGQAIRLYPKAVGWSILLSTAIVMEGYDTLLLANFFALTQFQEKYGALQPDGTHVLSAAWRSGLTNGASVGEIIGLQFTGIFQDRFGYRKTILGALVMVTGFIFIVFFAQNVGMLLAGEILCGLAWGVFQTLTTAYASEVCPVSLRAYLTTYVNLCWVMGQFIGSGVLRGMLNVTGQWAYRIPFAVQWFWPVPLIIGCIFAPESPWWCVRHGKIEEAKHNLRRLTSRKDTDFDVDKTVAMMQHTNELERELSAGTSYWDCFQGVNLRRTEIVCITWLIQNICGSTFMGYSTNFYEQAGLAETNSFDMSMIQYALGAVGTILSWFVMARVGRRTIYLYGLIALCTLLFIIGFASLAPSHPSRNWAIGSMLVIFTFLYDFTVGPVCYSLVAELSSTRLRAKSIVLSRNTYNVGGIVVNILSNYQLTSTAWNWGAKTGFFWAGSCVLCITWVYFRLPEPKGRTYAELDILFEQRVSARKFSETKVDISGDLQHLTEPELEEK
jgi:SP family general alpha glucoside:H+ symporter-like MFS transporter